MFVRDRHGHSREWLALLCTDIRLPDDQVVWLYGKRWNIIPAEHHRGGEVRLRNLSNIPEGTAVSLVTYCCENTHAICASCLPEI